MKLPQESLQLSNILRRSRKREKLFESVGARQVPRMKYYLKKVEDDDYLRFSTCLPLHVDLVRYNKDRQFEEIDPDNTELVGKAREVYKQTLSKISETINMARQENVADFADFLRVVNGIVSLYESETARISYSEVRRKLAENKKILGYTSFKQFVSSLSMHGKNLTLEKKLL